VSFSFADSKAPDFPLQTLYAFLTMCPINDRVANSYKNSGQWAAPFVCSDLTKSFDIFGWSLPETIELNRCKTIRRLNLKARTEWIKESGAADDLLILNTIPIDVLYRYPDFIFRRRTDK
jgi:hypothetical protein